MSKEQKIEEIIAELSITIGIITIIYLLSVHHVFLEKYRIDQGLIRCKAEGYLQWTLPENCDVKK